MSAFTFNTTLDTVQDYITDARVLLQDLISPYRYDDPSLLTALNVALLEARRLRADRGADRGRGAGGRAAGTGRRL